MTLTYPTWPLGTSALVVGESLVDVVVRRDAEPTARPGGSPMNVAVGLARLGADVALATQFGDDDYGNLIAAHLDESGVDLVDRSERAGETTSTATATIGDDGAATYGFNLKWDVSRPDPTHAALVHAGSVAAFLQPGADAVLACLDQATGMTAFDANIRPSIIGDRASAVRQVARIADIVDVMKMSDEDATWLHPGKSLDEIARIYQDHGVALVAITCGSEGSLLRLGADVHEVPAPRVAVADTIGAGDSYMAGLLFALIAGGFEGRGGREFAFEDAESAARFAADCAAVTVQRVGANLPKLRDVAVPASR